MKKDTTNTLPVLFSPEPRYFLRIEDNDGNSESLAYFQLSRISRVLLDRESEAQIKLEFGTSGQIYIKGINTDHLLDMLEEEKVSLIRVGQSHDPSAVHISSIKYESKSN